MRNMTKNAMVTGAAGFVGRAVVEELIGAGYSVRALCKPSTDTRPLENLQVEIVRGDIVNEDDCLTACKGIDTVFHIAALFRQAKFPDSEYYRINRDGTAKVLNAAITSGVRKFVHCSTLGVNGDIPNPPADESQPYAPCDVYQSSKVEAEKVIIEAIEKHRIDATIIRPAMIWGPGDRRLFKLFKGIKLRKMPLIGNGKQLCHWILVQDLARAFRLAAEVPAARGQTYIIAGQKPLSLLATMQQIARSYDVALLPFRVPVYPIYLLGGLCELLCAPFGVEPPLFRRRVAFFMKSRAYVTKKAESELGFKSKFSVEDEIQHIAKWYLKADWL